MKATYLARLPLYAICLCSMTACMQSGPDKTLGGAVLGAGWGAGAGAVVGNQVGHPGYGTGVGAGLGAGEGMLVGINADIIEGTQLQQQRELDAMKAQNAANANDIASLQTTLDRAVSGGAPASIYQVFFDVDATNLRTGAIANLETIANSLQRNPEAYTINVVGHTDDTGRPDYNERLAEARARAVSSYLAARGISVDQIKVQSFGAKRPIASNSTESGRQLNRRVDVYLGR